MGPASRTRVCTGVEGGLRGVSTGLELDATGAGVDVESIADIQNQNSETVSGRYELRRRQWWPRYDPRS
jgi:hypothetical protein